MKKIVIICNGAFGKEMQIYLQDAYAGSREHRFERIQDLFPEDAFAVQPDEVFVIANGEPEVKAKLAQKIEKAGGAFLTFIHPTCYVAPTATIGVGAILCPFAFVGPGAVLEPHVTMNVHSGCGHNARLGTCSVLSPYASVSGAATLEERVFLGSYAFVAPEKRVGAGAKVSAGAFAMADVPARGLAVGNPARVIADYFQ